MNFQFYIFRAHGLLVGKVLIKKKNLNFIARENDTIGDCRLY